MKVHGPKRPICLDDCLMLRQANKLAIASESRSNEPILHYYDEIHAQALNMIGSCASSATIEGAVVHNMH